MENVKQKYTPKIIDILAYQQTITNQGNNYTGEKDRALNKIVELIDLAIAERDKQMVEMIKSKGIFVGENRHLNNYINDIINLITNSKK